MPPQPKFGIGAKTKRFMNAKLKLVGIVMLTFLINLASAQPPTASFRGLKPKYGDGRDGDRTPTSTIPITTGGILYTDEQRAVVTDVSITNISSGTYPYQYTISHDADHGDWTSSGIAAGDVILLFQAYQEKDRNDVDLCKTYLDEFDSESPHFFLYVTGVSSGQIIGQSDVHMNNTLIPNTITGDDMVQIQRIHQFGDVELPNNFTVTCHAFDGETGGLLVVMINGELHFNGSNIIFDANEKGLTAGTGNPNRGANSSVSSTRGAISGGNGGNASTAIDYDTDKYSVSYTLTSTSCTEEFGFKGGLGSHMLKGSNPAPHDISSTIGCLTTEPYFINMGSGGKGSNAGLEGAATGGAGGAGAYGAGGGATASPTLTTSIPTGSGSGIGGNGATGGGLICVWAYEYKYDPGVTTNKIFQAKGGNATDGGNGDGVGTDGGDGGNGGDGVCDPPYSGPGGRGGFGQGGNGADAGHGGDAGMPGFIRFYTYNVVTNTMNQADVCIVDPGERGVGGEGDGHGANGVDGNDGAHDLGGSCVKCYDTEITKVTDCSCANAFALIGGIVIPNTGLLNQGTGSGTSFIYHNDNANFDNNLPDYFLKAQYFSDELLIVTTKEITQVGISPSTNRKITVTSTLCRLEDRSTGAPYNPIPDLISNISGTFLGSNVSSGTSQLGANLEFVNDAVPLNGDLNEVSPFAALAYGANDCNYTSGSSFVGEPRKGLDGKGGLGKESSGGGDPSLYRGGEDYDHNFDADNIHFSTTEAPMPPPTSIELISGEDVLVFPNPASKNLVVKSSVLNFSTIKNVEITNIQGKQSLGYSFVINDESILINNLDVLSNGTYILHISTETNSYTLRFLINN